MNNGPKGLRKAFTLIELLVVVAIIALLLSILLPSLQCARANARAAACGVILRGFGTGFANYESENDEWFPGVNTTGIVTRVAKGSADALRDPSVPVQSYDWLSPIIRYDTQISGNRAERYAFLLDTYGCPSIKGQTVDSLFGQLGPDSADFGGRDYPVISYLMPAHFQLWGAALWQETLAQATSPSGRTTTIRPRTVRGMPFNLQHRGRYRSRISMVGPPSRKVAVADGTRYFDGEQVDFDPSPDPRFFGAFTSNGAWWSGGTAYGVKAGSRNWTGQTVGAGSPANGENLILSYRHGCVAGQAPTTVHDNKGTINALFFDGHVARLTDRQSRDPELWYPTGATFTNGLSDGLIQIHDPTEPLP